MKSAEEWVGSWKSFPDAVNMTDEELETGLIPRLIRAVQVDALEAAALHLEDNAKQRETLWEKAELLDIQRWCAQELRRLIPKGPQEG